MAAQQADQREQLYAVDVSTLEGRQVKCMSVDTRSDGKKMKTLLFDDGARLAVVASPLPKGGLAILPIVLTAMIRTMKTC